MKNIEIMVDNGNQSDNQQILVGYAQNIAEQSRLETLVKGADVTDDGDTQGEHGGCDNTDGGVLFDFAIFCDPVDQQCGKQAHRPCPGIKIEIEREPYHCAAKRGMRQSMAHITHAAQYYVSANQAA